MPTLNRAPATLVIDARYSCRLDDGILLTAQRPDRRWAMFDPRDGVWFWDDDESFATPAGCYFHMLSLAEEAAGA